MPPHISKMYWIRPKAENWNQKIPKSVNSKKDIKEEEKLLSPEAYVF